MAETAPLPSSYASLMRQAEELHAAGDTDGSLAILERLLRRVESLSDATLRRHPEMAGVGRIVTTRMAQMLQAHARYDEAIAVIRRTERFVPETADQVERIVALLLLAKGEIEEARAALTSLTERFPHDPDHWLALGQMEAVAGDYDAADAALQRALETLPEDETLGGYYLEAFRAYAHLGRLEQALVMWDLLAEEDADLAYLAAPELYRLLLRTGDLSDLRTQIDLDESSIRAGFYRGLLAQREGDHSAARRHWERILAESPLQSAAGRIEWLEAALRTGDLVSAVGLALQQPPDLETPEARLRLAIMAAMSGELESAAETIQEGAGLLGLEFPWRPAYSYQDWELFTSLVDNRELWNAVRPYFDTEPPR